MCVCVCVCVCVYVCVSRLESNILGEAVLKPWDMVEVFRCVFDLVTW